MNNDVNYTEYNEEKNRIPWLRMFISLLLLVVIVVIILLLLRACGKDTNLRQDLVEAGKSYYEKFPSLLPSEKGECLTVELSALEQLELIDKDKYSSCDKDKTYVNVCLLDSGKYQYSGILSCTDNNEFYGMYKDGTESDLKEDESDVRYMFIGEELTDVISSNKEEKKYYYPGNETNSSSIDEYYIKSPASGYTYKEGQTTGYKWYTETTKKVYLNDGEYSSTGATGYTKGESRTVNLYSSTKPEEASYRTISNDTVYRTLNVAKPYKYICTSKTEQGQMVGTTVCGYRTDSFTILSTVLYTCDGSTTVKNDTPCGEYSEWTTTKCESSVANGIKCEAGYAYTDTQWKWYKNEKVRSYYPSKSASASGEKTYYVSQPVSGAIKDTNTKAQVYKFYKLVTTNNEITNKEFKDVTGGYVTFEELIKKFKELNYDVETLKDINELEEIRYQYKLQYRNIEE